MGFNQGSGSTIGGWGEYASLEMKHIQWDSVQYQQRNGNFILVVHNTKVFQQSQDTNTDGLRRKINHK